MAYAVAVHAGQPGLLARLRRGLADRRIYRATCDALDALSDRQLADIGIPRGNIRPTARAAAYAG